MCGICSEKCRAYAALFIWIAFAAEWISRSAAKATPIKGESGQYLGLIERGKNYISIEKLKVLCDLTGYTADYILFGDETDVIVNTKMLLKKFDKEQIVTGCKMLKKMALLIKGND